MSDTLRIACVQFTGGPEKSVNLEKADRLVARAAAAGGELVLLPENWNVAGEADVVGPAAETVADGESIAAMSGWARRHGIVLIGGSIPERREGHAKPFNTCFVFAANGEVTAAYRKIHLFDVDVNGTEYRESDQVEAGDEPVLVQADSWRVGLSICYDLRFPELYRVLALDGAELITVPAAFTLFTGKDHWEVLLRARAIENQVYVAAAGQCGEGVPGKPTYGRSLIADPWGIVLASAPDEETVISAEIDKRRLQHIRMSLPSLANRRAGAYREGLRLPV